MQLRFNHKNLANMTTVFASQNQYLNYFNIMFGPLKPPSESFLKTQEKESYLTATTFSLYHLSPQWCLLTSGLAKDFFPFVYGSSNSLHFKCDLIWKGGLDRIIKLSSSYITVALKPMPGVTITANRARETGTPMRTPGHSGGRVWSATPTSWETPTVVVNHQMQRQNHRKDPPSEPQEPQEFIMMASL